MQVQRGSKSRRMNVVTPGPPLKINTCLRRDLLEIAMYTYIGARGCHARDYLSAPVRVAWLGTCFLLLRSSSSLHQDGG